MGSPMYGFHNQNNILYLKLFFILLFLGCIPDRTTNLPSNQLLATPTSSANSLNLTSALETLSLDGYFTFKNNHHAAKDFGNTFQSLPLAVLHPKSVSDISSTIKLIFELGSASELTVAARGHGHSLQGQAQTHGGLVINMESLKAQQMQVHIGEQPYVDVSGGELHLTVGGTLSYAGISGQAFRHGPQINNVYQLEVVTGMFTQYRVVRKCHEDLNLRPLVCKSRLFPLG